MKTLLFILFVCFSVFILCVNDYVFAEVANSVLINEFAIEPEQKIELINLTPNAVDISGWHLDDSGGTTFVTIPPQTLLYPQSCLVFTGSFNLNKSSSDIVRLFNSIAVPTDIKAVLVDSYTYSKSPGENISLLRKPDGSNSWSESASNFGSWNETNQSCTIMPTETPTPTPSPTTIITPTPTTTENKSLSVSWTSYDNIYINEVMAAPETGEKEWIELYNDNDFTVELNNWYIDDVSDGGSVPKKITVKIDPKSFVIVEFSSSIFNNAGDSVRLLDGEEHEKFVYTFENSEKEYTWGAETLKSTLFCIQKPSQNAANSPCISGSPSNSNQSSPPLYAHSVTIAPSKAPISKSSSKTQSDGFSRYVIHAIPPKLHENKNSSPQTETVLGATTDRTQNNKTQQILPFLSLSYSLLSISSLLVKIVLSRVS